ncbi:MAG: type II toxin-antitoxin system VapC family toxin [Pseudomonadota bacterium]|nr:type II toxin-antitoxin system VapC family toxin [Pseudomonadota bacterium]
MIILDTNVLSELMRPEPEYKVVAWVQEQADQELYTTALTKAEILFGLAILPVGKRRSAITSEAARVFSEDFPGRVLAFSGEAAVEFAALSAQRRRQGRPISVFDGMIAGIARWRGAAIATRNTADFEGIGIRLVDPWS